MWNERAENEWTKRRKNEIKWNSISSHSPSGLELRKRRRKNATIERATQPDTSKSTSKRHINENDLALTVLTVSMNWQLSELVVRYWRMKLWGLHIHFGVIKSVTIIGRDSTHSTSGGERELNLLNNQQREKSVRRARGKRNWINSLVVFIYWFYNFLPDHSLSLSLIFISILGAALHFHSLPSLILYSRQVQRAERLLSKAVLFSVVQEKNNSFPLNFCLFNIISRLIPVDCVAYDFTRFGCMKSFFLCVDFISTSCCSRRIHISLETHEICEK